VYKAWAIRVDDFLAGCAALGVPDGLNVVDCGYNAGNFHGFVPAHSKTDNFKAKLTRNVREIDTRFFQDLNNDGHKQDGEVLLDGLQVTWTDPLGASNKKSSYYAPELDIRHEAHVEAIEDGRHYISIADQPGCKVGLVHIGENGIDLESGPQTVGVDITAKMKEITVFLYVACTPL
jgi:hypothetical protein